MSDDFERVVCKFIQFKSLNSVTLSKESSILSDNEDSLYVC